MLTPGKITEVRTVFVRKTLDSINLVILLTDLSTLAGLWDTILHLHKKDLFGLRMAKNWASHLRNSRRSTLGPRGIEHRLKGLDGVKDG